ncbi:histone deacetylase family protein [Thiobacillus denitrificans ATCC 25259]|uniref:Histone deacetylase family protein n=1 Tax=Thiobacillus denitrificans (strain ATCC 25259 / T1) TaxID=292415 RepID=Q3SET9_THIDA|nr:histone deacetylase family protein [Thiobacillus denitrificans]AAZ97978.1 histone deacetylase family protein [Thiobacillus denitrificans ATCC 25259]
MHTAYLTHADCLMHDMGSWHPESPARLRAIDDRLHAAHLFDHLAHHEAPRVQRAQLLRVHDAAYVDFIEASSPEHGVRALDADTSMNPHTLSAALRAAGGAAMAVDLVMGDDTANAFVACRPPGHHATRRRAMGFCIFNNVAVAAAQALDVHGLERVAIVDFDVHHGNGTEDIFRDDPRVMLCSTFQHPFYPFAGADTASAHIVNVPLPAGTDGARYRDAFRAQIVPRLDAFAPQMLFCSAGFDGHREDDMAQFGLLEADYVWITEQVMAVAARHACGRIVSVLEGGYDLSSLGRSAAAHIKTLAAL